MLLEDLLQLLVIERLLFYSLGQFKALFVQSFVLVCLALHLLGCLLYPGLERLVDGDDLVNLVVQFVQFLLVVMSLVGVQSPG